MEQLSGSTVLVLWLSALSSSACNPTGPGATLLPANVVDPQTVNAVSIFNSCVGHAYPEQNSPNSGKNYFWPTSANFSTTAALKEFAACDGMLGQASDDQSANEQDRGRTFHLYCDNSATSLRYFHLTAAAGIVGQHVTAGDFLGYASMLGTGQTPSASWQYSSNFDIAVSDGDDNRTQDYFDKLTPAAFAAWGARGLTSVSQTISPGNQSCSAYSSNVGDPGIFVFSPSR